MRRFEFSPGLERVLYFTAQILLLVALGATVYFSAIVGVVGSFYPNDKLIPASEKIWSSLWRYNATQIRDLAFYPPPEDSSKLGVWCDSIETHLGYPVAIFMKRDSIIRFVRVPDHLKLYADQMPGIFSPQTPTKFRARADTIGNMLIWHGEVMIGKQAAIMSCFERRGQDWNTGILRRSEDMLRAFSPHLFEKKSVQETEPYAHAMLFGGPYVALRVMDSSRTIGVTPGTDTTNDKWVDTVGAIRFEYYLPHSDQWFANGLRSPVLKFLMALDVLLMVVLFFFHRWFKQLTAKENQEQN